MKLSTRLPALLLPMTLVPLFLVAFIAYLSLQKVSIAQGRDELEQLTDGVAATINTHLEISRGHLAAMASDSLLQACLEAPPSVRDDLYVAPLIRKWKQFRQQYAGFGRMQLLDDEGQVLVDEKAHLDPTPLVPAASLTDAGRAPGVFVIPPLSGADPELLLILKIDFMAHPAGGRPHRAHAWLVTTIDSGFVRDTLSVLHREDVSMLMINQRGQLLMSDGYRFTPEVARSLIANQDTTSGILDHGGTRFVTHREQLLPGLSIITAKSLNDLTQATQHLKHVVTWVSLGAAVFSVLVVTVVMRRLVTRPLQQLSEATRAIARGSREKISGADMDDEVGELARAMDHMRSQIDDSRARIEEMAYRDALTGLPNRAAFMQRILETVGQKDGKETRAAVIFVDIDNFKTINDSLGHDKGDTLLREVGHRLQRWLDESAHPCAAHYRARVTVARMGGDEFTMLVEDILAQKDAGSLLDSLREQLAHPFDLAGTPVFISVSAGVTFYPDHGNDVSQLLRQADLAMYSAKGAGRNTWRIYDGAMEAPVAERLALESSLREALNALQFEIHFQPKVALGTSDGRDFEALVRWKHPQQGYISPARFIPIAEETGIILPLTDWILDQTCWQVRQWLDAGRQDVKVSVNLSPVHLNAGNPVRSVREAIERHAIPARHLEVEITESGLMQNESQAVRLLNDLKALGISIALDDFGTGYSSLAYLRRFPIDVLKIDRAFIIDVDTDGASAKMLGAILRLAESLSLKVVAEGVETVEQLVYLQRGRCHLVQGYVFSRPLPAADAMAFFDRHASQG